MFEPWRVQVEKTITVEELYGTANPSIPTGFRGIAFRPAKRGEKWLGRPSGQVVTAYSDYSENCPVIILAPALTEIEEKYGEGETVESVWAKHCPCPEEYGEPRADGPPYGNKSAFAWISFDGRFIEEIYGSWNMPGLVYAYRLNDWQILYGEAIPDAAALEAKLRAEGELGENQFIEAELMPVDRDLWFVSKDPYCRILRSHVPFIERPFRAIVGTRKRRYLRVPVCRGDVVQISIPEKRSVSYVGISEFPGAQIVED